MVSKMGILHTVGLSILHLWRVTLNWVIPKGTGIPEPGVVLKFLLNLVFGNEKLQKLEFLTEFYYKYGVFRYETKIYIFDPTLAQSAINKLEKGAEEYLKNSPLKDTFLGSSSKSPEVRRAIASIFRKTSIEERGKLIIADIDKLSEKIQHKSEKQERINITELSQQFALDVVGHVLLDLDLFALEDRQKKLLDCLTTILHRCYALGEISDRSQEYIQANQDFERLTTAILEDALNKESPVEEKKFVKKLHEVCGFVQACDNMKLFLMAGSETTASTIPVIFSILTAYPELLHEIQSEADQNMAQLRENPTISLPRTEAFMKEILRIYPIAPFISRRTFNNVTLGNVVIPANSDLIVFTWGIHRSENNWAKAKQFVPFRFLKNDLSHGSMYIPFGAGSRICIGQHLAWLELKLVVAILLHKFDFSKIPETPDLRFVVDWAHAVVHPDMDMIFKVTCRK